MATSSRGKTSSQEDATPLLVDFSPPPYHEASAPAYPKMHPSRRLYKMSAFRTGLALLLTLQLFWICFWTSRSSHSRPRAVLSVLEEKRFQSGLASCAAIHKVPTTADPKSRKGNPRWNPVSGQKKTVILRNSTLFDGEAFLEGAVDIVFSKGLVVSVTPAAESAAVPGAHEVNLHGAYVTPGLVDMHSHHMTTAWPTLDSTEDGNEMHPDFGPLTPFVRALDGLKAYDVGTKIIASGGVTSSLVIPGSANIMGGEGTVVKNAMKAGPAGEYVVEEMLLEHGIDFEDRRRYMKMACGENPKREYGHTRMGNAFLLRKWLARAKDLIDKQDGWCEAAGVASTASVEDRVRLLAEKGGFPQELELESTAGMLRGRVAMHNHCYEPEDMETMLRNSHEFGFRVRAFHHAIAAWQVPEMLKEYGDNITIATFAEFSLYKKEAYAASLSAGKILNAHGVPVAYKSDHSSADLSSKYLMSQAAVGHSFGLPADKALQAVTSIPAAAIDMDHRIGYTRPNYDADIVVWDAHPLSVGATPKQVFIDGLATLDPAKVEESSAHAVVKQGDKVHQVAEQPAMRAVLPDEERHQICSKARRAGQGFVISGIRKSFLDDFPDLLPTTGGQVQDQESLTLVIDDGEITCLGAGQACHSAASQLHQDRDDDNVVSVQVEDGHLTRGLTAVSSSLGIAEISMDPATGDGVVKVVSPKDAKDPRNIDHAKYAVSLGGSKVKSKTFARARLGGVTRAVQAPVTPMTAGGLVTGVSVGIRTGEDSTLLNGGIFAPDVAMHVALGEDAKVNEGTVSMALERLRALVTAGGKRERAMEDDDFGDPWALVANGSMPLVIKAESEHDIQQVILLKKDYPDVNAVILGGNAAPLFADEIAKAKIPIILTATRPGPDAWTTKDSLPGPPLSRSPADVLNEAGVFYGIAIRTIEGDSRIQSHGLEASWAAKYAGLSEHAALRLVSTNVDEILGLEKSGDIVLWEGNPLQFGTPVLAFQAQEGKLKVGSCWPGEADD